MRPAELKMDPKIVKQQIRELCELMKQKKIDERGVRRILACLEKAEQLGLKAKFKHGILFVWEEEKNK